MYNGVAERAERFMVKWREQEKANRCARHAKEVVCAARDRRGRGRTDNDRRSRSIVESKDEMADGKILRGLASAEKMKWRVS